jgi:hypothetical protein
MKKIVSTLVCALLLPAFPATAGPSATPSYRPINGYVPDAKTAIQIAVAVWSPIYANLKRGVWTVTGSMPPSKEGVMFGGVALARISKADGRILQIIHGDNSRS